MSDGSLVSVADDAGGSSVMDANIRERYPVLKSVGVVTATIIALFGLSICLGALAAEFKLDLDLPFALKLLLSIAPVAVGATWFGLKVNRPMSNGELARFALGMAAIDVVTSVLPVAAVSRLGSVGLLAIAAMNVVFGLTTGCLFGWLLTRKRTSADLT